MKAFSSLILLFALLPFTIYCQNDPYQSRGAKSFLVNYGAIKGDPFLARFAAQRFVLIDEAGRYDIDLIHAEKPSMPILRYKDIVALHATAPEYATVDKDEWAFMHSCEPSGLVIRKLDSLYTLEWIADRRSYIDGYRLYWMTDSLGSRTRIDYSPQSETYTSVDVPDSAHFLCVASMDGLQEYNYGLPVRIETALLQEYPLIPDYISDTRAIDTIHLNYVLRETGIFHPDTVYIIGDWDRNNQLHPTQEKYRMNWAAGKWRIEVAIPTHGARTNCGYEFQIEVHHNGSTYICPEEGKWHTNLNNRTKNDTYGFYVMNVGSPTWRQAYIDEVLSAFSLRGYTGLFEDDCWFRIANYGVDSYPPVPYFESEWRPNLYAMLDSIRIAIAPKPAYFNGLYTDISDSLLLHTDGGMTEGFSCTHWSGLVGGNSWRNQCNRGLSAQHTYKKTWMALGGSSESLIDERMYVLASYLLVEDDLSMLGNALSYQQFAHYPEFDIPLGQPLNSAHVDIEDLAVEIEGERIYVRDFENGTVVVNPASVPVVYETGAGRKSIAAVGGTTVDGGRVETRKVVHLLHPATAMIYLNVDEDEVLESPVIDSVMVQPPVVIADGETRYTVSVLAHDSSASKFMSDSSLPVKVILDASALGGSSEFELMSNNPTDRQNPQWFSGELTVQIGVQPDSLELPILVHSPTGLVTVGKVPFNILSADPDNILLNYSFEIDGNNDDRPDYWNAYVEGFDYDKSGANAVTGSRSVHVMNDNLEDYRGVYVNVEVNQTQPAELYLSGWSKAVSVSGDKNNDYSLYADIRYTDGTSLYGQTAQFNTGTHDWEFSGKVISPEKPIKSISLYALMRHHTGEAWFDQLSLKEYDPTAVHEPPTAGEFQCEVYPNPAQERIQIAIVGPESTTEFTIGLYNVLGRRILSPKVLVASDGRGNCTIDTGELTPGVYFLHVTGKLGSQVKPVLVAHP